MKNCCVFFVLLLIAASACFTPVAHATDADSAAGKCLAGAHIVKIIRGNFSSSSSPQRIVVTRAMNATKKGVVCTYHIGWEFFQPITRTWLSEGDGWTYAGPGLVFFDGLWQPQSTGFTLRLKVEPVQVLGKLTQLAIYRETDSVEGTYSDLAIYAILGGYGSSKTLLHVADEGPLTYHVENEVIDIKGAYSSPPRCNACDLTKSEVRLKYDPGAGQMAIVNNSEASDMFYKSILGMGAGLICGTPAGHGHGYEIAPCVR